MRQFTRVLPYIGRQWKMLAVCILCTVCASGLLSSTITAAQPMMQVMINDEGLDGWGYQQLAKLRTGLKFEAANLNSEKLIVKEVVKDKPAAQAGFKKGDIIVAVTVPDMTRTFKPAWLSFVGRLVHAPPGVNVECLVRREGESAELPLTLTMDPTPFNYIEQAGDYAYRLHEYHQTVSEAEFKKNSILMIVLVMVVAAFVGSLLRFANEYLVVRIGFRAIYWLRMDAFRHILRLPMSYFSNQGISDATSRFVQDANQIMAGLKIVMGQLVSEPIALSFLITFAFMIHAKMTLLLLVAAPIAGFLLSRLGKKMKRAAKKSLESWAKTIGRLQGTLLGIRVVKGYHQEAVEQERMEAISGKLLTQMLKVAKIDAAAGPLMEALGAVGLGAIMLVVINWVVSGELSPDKFIPLVGLFAAMAQSVRKLSKVFVNLQTSNAAAERIYQLMDIEPEPDVPNGKELPPLRKQMEFRNISFTYLGSPVKTLDHVNLTVKAGETVAIVGPNGSGKTTLLSLIARFYVPDEGTIYIDGQDIAQVALGSLRSQLGIVTQQSIVFKDTIAVNIAYGKPNATREEIIDAAQRAYAHEFITATANGYDTIVGEQGATLSGGQLQRLAIARAILKDPAILIFDEATSQIDSDSEAKIHKVLSSFARERTAFIIAHRLSTIMNADRIVVMDQGKIVAQGTHATLIQECPLYRKLYETQFSTGWHDGPGEDGD